jgi:hypothetical protein
MARCMAWDRNDFEAHNFLARPNSFGRRSSRSLNGGEIACAAQNLCLGCSTRELGEASGVVGMVMG